MSKRQLQKEDSQRTKKEVEAPSQTVEETLRFSIHLGRFRDVELTEWKGAKRIDIRHWIENTKPTKEGVSLPLDQWKALCNLTGVLDDVLIQAVCNEFVDFSDHLGENIFVRVKSPHYSVRLCKFWSSERELTLDRDKWKELKKVMPVIEQKIPEIKQLVSLYRTDV